MANTDVTIDNASGQTVREDIQTNLRALKNNNSTTDGNTPTGANVLTDYMWWANKSAKNQLMVNNGGSVFTPVIDISGGTGTGRHMAPGGTASHPGYSFTQGDGASAQTGMFSSANDRIGFSVQGSERLTLLGGSLGIGTTSPTSALTVLGDQTIYTTGSDAILNISVAGSNNYNAYIDLVADTTNTDYGARLFRSKGTTGSTKLIHKGAGGDLILECDGGTTGDIVLKANGADKWKVDSTGTLAASANTTTYTPHSGSLVAIGIRSRQGTATNAAIANSYNFYWTGTVLECWIDGVDVGDVTIVSDYRVKKNVALQTESGIDRIKRLKPVTFEFTDYKVFKADGVSREGFIAHELQEVIPSGVTGEKDGEKIQSLKLDAIVSVLTKALQEAVAKIETLETKVAALEAK